MHLSTVWYFSVDRVIEIHTTNNILFPLKPTSTWLLLLAFVPSLNGFGGQGNSHWPPVVSVGSIQADWLNLNLILFLKNSIFSEQFARELYFNKTRPHSIYRWAVSAKVICGNAIRAFTERVKFKMDFFRLNVVPKGRRPSRGRSTWNCADGYRWYPHKVLHFPFLLTVHCLCYQFRNKWAVRQRAMTLS